MFCYVPGCSSKWTPDQTEKIFHALSQNSETKAKWLKALGLSRLSEGTGKKSNQAIPLICSDHFKEGDYRVENGRKVLKANAVPCYRLKFDKDHDNKISEAGAVPTVKYQKVVLLKRPIILKTVNAATQATKIIQTKRIATEVLPRKLDDKKPKLDPNLPSTSHAVFVKCDPDSEEFYNENNAFVPIKQEIIEEDPMQVSVDSIPIKQEPTQDSPIEIKQEPEEDPDLNITHISVEEMKAEIKEEQLIPFYTEAIRKDNITQTSTKKSVCSRGVQTTFDSDEELEEESEEMKEKIKFVREKLEQLIPSESFSNFTKSLENDEKKAKFYMRMDYNQFLELFQTLSPKEPLTEATNLKLEEQLVFVLSRLRTGLSALDLSFRFNIPVPVCKAVLDSWIRHSYDKIKSFKTKEIYKSVTIINCVKFNFQSPLKIPNFSRIPHEVCKVLIGSSMDGTVWFVSEPMSDSVEDKDLIKESKIGEVLKDGDELVPGKIFSIMDRNDKQVKLDTGAFRKRNRNLVKANISFHNESQLVDLTCKLKEFKLLKRILLAHMKEILPKIIYVCAYLLKKY